MTLRTVLFVALIGAGLILISVRQEQSLPETETPPLRIGWVLTWAAAGHIMVALNHSDILETVQLDARVIPYTLGPQINEAGLRGEVDVITVASVPTVALLTASDDWVVIARLVDFLQSTIVSADSGIDDLKQLAGKRVAVPFGAGAHPYFVSLASNTGLSAARGVPDAVQLLNMRPPEQIAALRQGTVDAIATWEPASSILLKEGTGRLLHEGVHSGFVMIRRELVEDKPEQVLAFLSALSRANYYVAQNRNQVDKWFAEVSGFEEHLLAQMKVIEPNFSANSLEEIDISLTPRAIAHGQHMADEMYRLGLTGKEINFESFVVRF